MSIRTQLAFHTFRIWIGSGACIGQQYRIGPAMHNSISKSPFDKLRIIGITSRLDLLGKLRLFPEEFDLLDVQRFTKFPFNSVRRYFTVSFHSPSFVPGNTVFVNSKSELHSFIQGIDAYLSCFIPEFVGISKSPSEFSDFLLTYSQHGLAENVSKTT